LQDENNKIHSKEGELEVRAEKYYKQTDTLENSHI